MPAKRKPPKLFTPLREGRALELADRARCLCVSCDEPTPGSMCETVHGFSVAFYYYCAECWLKPAANGGPSAAERTGVDLPDALDFERRWLAECRAHGETLRLLNAACDAHAETRRQLVAAQHELGDHSDCIDCDRGEGEEGWAFEGTLGDEP